MKVHSRSLFAVLIPTLATLLVNPATATDWKSVDLKCPIDGTRFEATVVASIFLSGYSTDFRPLGVGVDQYVASLAICPACGFSAHMPFNGEVQMTPARNYN